MKKTIIIGSIILIAFVAIWTISEYKSKSSAKNINQEKVKVESKITSNQDSKDNTSENNNQPKNKTKEFNMVAKQFTYEPDTITVNKDDIVVINLESKDVPHSFTLPDFQNWQGEGINATLHPGEKVTIEFKADKSGEFVFGCDVACGTGHTNMLGKLIVN